MSEEKMNPFVEALERAERSLAAAYDRNDSQRTALMRIAEAATLEEAKDLAVGALTQFA